MPYQNPTNLSNGFFGLMEYTNSTDISGGWFGILILILIYVSLSLYLINKGYNTFESMTSSGFLCLIVGIFLNMQNLITNTTMYLTFVALIIPVFLMFASKGE